jgi:restriction system protein
MAGDSDRGVARQRIAGDAATGSQSAHPMTDTPTFHFPPDVFNAVVDAVPLLVRGKKDVLTFFQGCGVSRVYLGTLEPWTSKDSGYSKYHITRHLLTYLNELGDAGLAQRRQLIKRVAEFENFSTCYPDNQLKAKGAVAAVAQLVNKKDSFTRIQEEHDRVQRQHREAKEAEIQRLAQKQASREQVKADLYRLFGDADPHRRGKTLEGVLNRLFQAHDILVREAFTVASEGGGGVIEQIDGAVEIDQRLYLVEMKWWSEKLGRAEVAPHLVSVYGRADVGGVLISNSGYHTSAIAECRTALAQRPVILVELHEIVTTLDRNLPLLDLLRGKLREAALTKQPLTYPLGPN